MLCMHDAARYRDLGNADSPYGRRVAELAFVPIVTFALDGGPP